MFDSWRRLRHRPALHTCTLGHRAPRLREEQTTNSVSAIGAAAGVLYAQYLAYRAYLPYCSRRYVFAHRATFSVFENLGAD